MFRIHIPSVVDPVPAGSGTFCRIRIRIRNKQQTELSKREKCLVPVSTTEYTGW